MKTKKSNTTRRLTFKFSYQIALLSIGVSTLIASPVLAAVLVTDGQVTNNNFTFSIGFDSTVAGSPEINAGDFTNASPEPLGGHVNIYSAPGTVLYDFDFSGSSYRPSAVALRDRITLFFIPTCSALTEWSTNLTQWQTIRAVMATGGVDDSISNIVVAIPGAPSHFYYRASYTDSGGSVFYGDHAQWNRSDGPDEDSTISFNASFTVTAFIPLGYNQITGQLLSGGDMRLSFVGFAGTNYALDRTFNLVPLVNWVPQLTNAADGSGVVIFTNTPNPTTNNFWRIRSAP